MNPYHIAYISVGSNLGQKEENCRSGIAALIHSSHARLVGQSPFYQTEPVDYLDQEWFTNCVVKIETDLDPLNLLSTLKSIEQAAGRVKDTIRFGPRILDMDIILFDDLVMRGPSLTVPHPRMHKRRFVLKPMCDIDPDVLHPVLKRTMGSLLRDLDEKGQRIVEYK
ncbi:MAG: 2-amino-4-hydroxy-6-hydroxymethyldihydropteridine diphosphokinase [Desulfobacterales bacterium]